jgi:periplasmic mercuric ion binding protein
MRTKVLLLISGLLMLVSQGSFAQADKKVEEIKIKSSAVCNQCKDRIESGLAYEKGVKSSSVDVKTKVITVKYNPAKTNPDQIRKAISALGYDADNVPADKTAYAKLPACCKKDAETH